MADLLRFKKEEASISKKAEIDLRPHVHPSISDTDFGNRTHNGEKAGFVQETPSDMLAELHQKKETNRATSKSHQYESAVYALQMMPEESDKNGIVPFLFPTNVDKVCKILRDDRKRKSTGLSDCSDISPVRSLLEQKRSKSELDAACNAAANNMFVPLPVFSSSDQGERNKDEMFHDNLQAHNRVLPPAKDLHQFVLENDARNLTFEQNMAFVSNSNSHRLLPSFCGPPVPTIPPTMLYPTIRPAVSIFDLHLQQQLDFHRFHLRNLLHQMNY